MIDRAPKRAREALTAVLGADVARRALAALYAAGLLVIETREYEALTGAQRQQRLEVGDAR